MRLRTGFDTEALQRVSTHTYLPQWIDMQCIKRLRRPIFPSVADAGGGTSTLQPISGPCSNYHEPVVGTYLLGLIYLAHTSNIPTYWQVFTGHGCYAVRSIHQLLRVSTAWALCTKTLLISASGRCFGIQIQIRILDAN
jgi:hypothetical protein